MKNLLHSLSRRVVIWVGARLLQELPGISRTLRPRFANDPKNLNIDWPWRISHPEAIFFGDDVWLGPGCFITAVFCYPTASLKHPEKSYESQTFAPGIRIGNRVTSSGNLIIGAARKVEIGDDVLIASNVTILDNMHGYSSIDVPYKYQPLERIAPVRIGAGSWLGQNAVILPGVTIGEMAIVGANSVVTSDIPSRAIAAGAPARVIKVWNPDADEWRAAATFRGANLGLRAEPKAAAGTRKQ